MRYSSACMRFLLEATQNSKLFWKIDKAGLRMDIKNVMVVGASGNIGKPIVEELLAKGFTVSALTRPESTSSFRPDVVVHKSDFSEASWLTALRGQDAVVCAMAIPAMMEQIKIIDAAVKCGVKRILPCDFGTDTAPSTAVEIVPPLAGKRSVMDLLRSKESDGVTWTALCCGMFFDWSLETSNMFWDLPNRSITRFDKGDCVIEATNLQQIGRAVAAILSREHVETTSNKYVYVHSFTTTQREVLALLEEATGRSFVVTDMTLDELAARGNSRLLKGPTSPEFFDGFVDIVSASQYGYGGLNAFAREAEVWNNTLGLPVENAEETVRSVVSKMKQ